MPGNSGSCSTSWGWMPWMAMFMGAKRMSRGRTSRCALWVTRPALLIQARPTEQTAPGAALAVSKSSAIAVVPAVSALAGIGFSVSMVPSADQREPVVLAQHRPAVLLALGPLTCRAGADRPIDHIGKDC